MGLAFTLLIASLAVFWLSTQQFKQPWRSLIWFAGAIMLAMSIWFLANANDHFGLFRAVIDAWEHRADPENAVLFQAFSRNVPSVSGFIPQLLDLFVIVAAVIGAFALIAFTRGEHIERALRPSIFVLWGFMAGAVTALIVVAIGFGGQVRQRGYFGQLAEADVHDGDTFWIGEMPLRLWGVDAPELTQVCSGVEDCGGAARRQLLEIAGDGLLRCEQMQRHSGSYVESFGRPLVRCWVRKGDGSEFDLGRRLIEEGFAVQYEGDASFGYSDAEARGRDAGVMAGCSLAPEVWRRNRAARAEFIGTNTLPANVRSMGQCGQ
ncbi:MAG: thermonuclease family protein [Hyphomonadaceae bacterium]|nr:thermonuclease family protein [Hyphomonadaceae bacterium]